MHLLQAYRHIYQWDTRCNELARYHLKKQQLLDRCNDQVDSLNKLQLKSVLRAENISPICNRRKWKKQLLQVLNCIYLCYTTHKLQWPIGQHTDPIHNHRNLFSNLDLLVHILMDNRYNQFEYVLVQKYQLNN